MRHNISTAYARELVAKHGSQKAAAMSLGVRPGAIQYALQGYAGPGGRPTKEEKRAQREPGPPPRVIDIERIDAHPVTHLAEWVRLEPWDREERLALEAARNRIGASVDEMLSGDQVRRKAEEAALLKRWGALLHPSLLPPMYSHVAAHTHRQRELAGLTAAVANEALKTYGSTSAAARAMGVPRSTFRDALKGSHGFVTVGLLINGGTFTGCAVVGPIVDRRTTWRPLGVAPSLMAAPVVFAGGYALRKANHHVAGDAIIAASLGLVTGKLIEAVHAKSAA